jgi:probable FeS assembly SUF system protein SufT
MSQVNECTLTRACKATVIPSGEASELPAGTKVTITHRLGGNFTVVCDFGMFRINGADADAIGQELPEEAKKINDASKVPHDGPPNNEKLWEQLKSVYDPEIPVNIVDLGLIYSLAVEEPEPKKYEVKVAMTLTAPGCGMGPAIAEDARSRLLQVPGVSDANVDIVWDPPWRQEMISEAGKMELGLI